MPKLDLDAARAEVSGDPVVVTVGGKDWTLLGRPTLALSDALDKGDTVGAVRRLLGDQFDEFAEVATIDDIQHLFEGWEVLYGATVGESEASDGSSTNGSGRSKQTSSARTGSTSAKRSGAKRR
jgi:hypothetical protein